MALEQEQIDLLGGLSEKMNDYKVTINYDKLKIQKDGFQSQMNVEGFWDDQETSKKVVIGLKSCKSSIDSWSGLNTEIKDCLELVDLYKEEKDDELGGEIELEIGTLKSKFDSYELTMLLSGPNDQDGAILEIHSGAGGTESCDWASMLFRMYLRWAERNGLKTEVLDMLNGEEAGIKSVSIEVKGDFAFGNLKTERGVHRLVRISPFDSNKKRHTSFASIDVTPIYDDIPEIEINPADLKIDTYRASGAGGQHINTTDSAVRITHAPSGVIVQCQNQRSQHSNKDKAMELLRIKLYSIEEDKRKKEVQDSYENKSDNSWGNQIRSYVLHPYQMIKDHRTNHEVGNVDPVLDGDINSFIESYLRLCAKQNS
ncbi:MAG: peptide chain release factor 2 [Planctomycetota bacterium]|nr:MAG: peptide chain release factor 2 [Planctomycetota bacterium]